MNISQVTATNTKTEILNAYNRLKVLTEQAQQKKQQPFRSQIIEQIDKIETEIANRRDESKQFEERIVNLKEDFKQEKAQWDEELARRKQEQKDESVYSKKRLDNQLDEKQWEFDQELKRKRKELAQYEQEFQQKATDHAKLKHESENFSDTIDKEIARAISQREKELKSQFATEQQIAKQQHTANKSLLEQTITTLTTRNKEYQTEIAKLEKQLADMSDKIKELAITALAKEPQQISSMSTTEK